MKRIMISMLAMMLMLAACATPKRLYVVSFLAMDQAGGYHINKTEVTAEKTINTREDVKLLEEYLVRLTSGCSGAMLLGLQELRGEKR